MEVNCPGTNFWRRYSEGSIAPEERPGAESHLASCHRCRQRLISFFDETRETQVEAAPDFLKNRTLGLAPKKEAWSFFASFRPFAPVALAATIVLAVGVSFLMFRNRAVTTPTSDLRQSHGTAHQVQLTGPQNGAQLAPGAIDFRWQDSTPEARYEFSLTDEKGDIVFQQGNAKSPLRLDAPALKLSPQHRYYWSVTARLPDGSRRESPVASFTIR